MEHRKVFFTIKPV